MTIRELPALENATAFSKLESDLAPAALEKWNASLAAADTKAEMPVIAILGMIGESFFSEGITDKSVRAQLQRIGSADLEVHINSPGGSIHHGTAIYNMLLQHKGRVTVKILGMAGSMASVVAMVGDEIMIAKAGFMFVHQSEAIAAGNRHVMEDALNALTEFDAVMAGVYSQRSGQTIAQVEGLMRGKNLSGTLLGSATVIEKGLADSILPASAVRENQTASAPPIATLHKIQNAMAKAGVSRTERRALIKEITGTPRAAEAAMQNAGGSTVVAASLADLESLVRGV